MYIRFVFELFNSNTKNINKLFNLLNIIIFDWPVHFQVFISNQSDLRRIQTRDLFKNDSCLDS